MPTSTENQNFDLNAVTAISCDNKDFLKIYDETNDRLVWLKKFRLTVKVDKQNYGTVVATYDDILAQNDGDFHKTITSVADTLTADIPFETEVTLKAVPKSATTSYVYKFSKWDDNQTAASRTVTMTDDMQLTANFKRTQKSSSDTKWAWRQVGYPQTGTDKLRNMMKKLGYNQNQSAITFFNPNNIHASSAYAAPNWILVDRLPNGYYATAFTSVPI